MELDRPAPGPNVRDAGAGPPVLARDEPAADEEPPLKGLSERPANEAEPLTTTRKPRQRKPSNKSVEAAAAKSKARKAKPPARKKTVAKLSSKAKATSTERKQSGYEFFRKKNREVAKAAVAADPKTTNLAGKDKDNAILRKLAAEWKTLSKAEQQKWKDDAPLAKVRVKSTDLPPPDDETKAQYKAFKATHPNSKDARTIEAFQLRDPASFSSFFTIVRLL